MVFRARNPLELRTLSSAAQPPAHAGREFVRTERLRVRIPVYGGASEGAVVSAKLLGARGVALTDLPTQRGAAPGVYEVDLTLTSVSLGSFLISIEARNGDERAEALVPFKVIR
jgi:hypothetical protein